MNKPKKRKDKKNKENPKLKEALDLWFQVIKKEEHKRCR
jgi:hypothetical protein